MKVVKSCFRKAKENKKKENTIIEMHATWLAVNSVIGCTNGCKYCFLQSTNKNISKPIYLKGSRMAIDDLIKSKYYLEDIPVCLLPNTDAFLNQKNMEYLKELLYEINKRNLRNPIILITKCYIPEDFIKYLKQFKDKGHKIVIYLSLSGLPQELEPNVNHSLIRKNFINLYKSGIDVIHYYRPITPLNSQKEDITKMLEFVSKYSNSSVIGGLKIKEDYFELIKFWPELFNMKKQCLLADAIWPKEAYDFFYNNYNHNQAIYQTNYCALMQTLNKTAISYYGTNECKNCNICPQEQREKCRKEFVRLRSKTKTEVIKQINKIGYRIGEENIEIEGNKIKLYGINLNVGDIAYLTFALSAVIISEKSNSLNYWNSPLNGSKPLVI